MAHSVDPDMVAQWLKAWSLSRRLPLPMRYKSGFKVEVGDVQQKARYVFTELNDDVITLSQSIDEPWVFLKICAGPEALQQRLPGKWLVQPQGYMMCCNGPMSIPDVRLPDNYSLAFDQYPATFVVKVMSPAGIVASIGRVVLVGDMAVYDRIATDANHRRKGLATFVMKELEKIAAGHGVFNNFLVATEAGKSLYQLLGWELYSLYTSVVIPA